MNTELDMEGKNYFISFFSISLTWITLITIGYGLSFIKNELDVKYIMETYNISLNNFVPEKSEKIQYIVLTILFPFVFIMFYKVIDKIKLSINNINPYLRVIALVASITVFYIINEIEPFYLSETILLKVPLIFLFLSIIIPCFIFLYEFCKKNIKKNINIILLFSGIISVLFTAWLYITKDYYFNTFTAHHFDAYFYPVYKVFSGQTILVDFNCLYGFYPYLLVPVLWLFGGVNMYNFSIVMAILVCITYLSILVSMWRLCSNKIITLLGSLSIMFFTCLFPMIYQGGPYYLQYLPHRMIFPAIFVLICTVYVYLKDNKSKKIAQIIGYLVSCISFLWNIDTGIILIATWCIFLIFLQMLEYDFNKKQLYVKSLKYIVFAISTIILAYIILGCITFERSGRWFRLADAISSQNAFYASGFYMIRMPLIHQWIILISIYSIGLAKSLKNILFIRKSELEYPKIRTKMYFVLSILGIGLFSYYQGRSHNFVFTSITWPGMILFVLYVDECISKIKPYYNNYTDTSIGKRVTSLNYLVKGIFGILILVCFSTSYIYNFKNDDLIATFKDKKSSSEQIIAMNAVNFVNEIRKNNEPIDLIMSYSASVYSILGEKSEVNVPATVDWYTKEDYRKVMDWIGKTENKIIFDSNSYNLLNTYNNKELNEVLNNKFILEKNTKDYLLFTPK